MSKSCFKNPFLLQIAEEVKTKNMFDPLLKESQTVMHENKKKKTRQDRIVMHAWQFVTQCTYVWPWLFVQPSLDCLVLVLDTRV